MNLGWRRGLAGVLVAGGICLLPAPAPASATVSPAGKAPSSQRLELLLPLVANSGGLKRFAQAVTTPGSPRYGDYESIAWLSRHFGASAQARSRVVAFLRRHGATGVRIDATGLFAQATLSVTSAQQMFATSLSQHRVGRVSFTAPVLPARIPSALKGSVTGVIGLDTRPGSVSSAVRGSASAPGTTTSSGYSGPDGTPTGCSPGLAPAGFAPNQYLDAYQYAQLHQAGIKGQGERVALIEIDGFNMADIRMFASCFGLNVPPIERDPVGLPRLPAAGGEATLDLEVLDAAAPRLKSIHVYETEPDSLDVLRALTAPLQGTGYKPNVISVSLGLCESDTLAAVGRAGVNTAEASLEEAAAAGISVLGASGDSGSAGCLSSSGDADTPLPQLAVIFPASSPWVTAVGGTNLQLTAADQIQNQVVWNEASATPGLAGGGGFSSLFARPRYQNGVVAQNQRALPDLALLSDVLPGYDVYCTAQIDCGGHGWLTFGGTSAATPLVAGGFALIDQLLRKRAEEPLGLANPLLYKLARTPSEAARVFYDVIQGSNDVGPFIQADGALLGCCSAAAGFDEASGWGGIDLASLAQAAESAQPTIGQVALKLVNDATPVARDGVSGLVSCTRACDLTLRVKVMISGQPDFTDYSRLTVLKARSSARIKITFTHAQLALLTLALERHQQVSAGLTVALTDASGNIERQTPTLPLTISG